MYTKGQNCLCFVCVHTHTVQSYTNVNMSVHQILMSVFVERTTMSTGCELLQWAAWLYVILSYCLTHALHYHSCAKGNGQGYTVRKNLWELNVVDFSENRAIEGIPKKCFCQLYQKLTSLTIILHSVFLYYFLFCFSNLSLLLSG